MTTTTMTRQYVQLTPKQVADIRNEYWQRGVSQVQLAKRYGISRANIGRIVRNETWVNT